MTVGTLYKKYKDRLRLALQKCLVGGQIDVFLIQEHHLDDENGFEVSDFLPK
jgi:hypothetical protein